MRPPPNVARAERTLARVLHSVSGWRAVSITSVALFASVQGCASIGTVDKPIAQHTVRNCISATDAFYTKEWERTFDTTRSPRYTIKDAQRARRQFGLNCVARYHYTVENAPDSLLPSLTELYSMIDEDSLARVAVKRSLVSPNQTRATHARQLVQAASTFAKDTTGLVQAQRYVGELEALGAAFLPSRLRGMLAILGLYQKAEWVDRAVAYGDSIMALEPVDAWNTPIRQVNGGDDPSRGNPVARAADSVHALVAQALVILASVNADAGRGAAAVWYTERVLEKYRDTPYASIARGMLPRMRLIGRPAPTITGDFWLSPRTSFRAMSPEPGQVTVLMFTTYWCESCPESAKAFERLYQRYKPTGKTAFHAVTHTTTIRPAKERRPKPITIKGQVAAIDSFFVRKFGLTMPIAIEAVDTAVAVSTGDTDDEHRYQVDGYPTFVVVDTTGRVKWMTTGWGEKVEAKLDRWIAQLSGTSPAKP